jgi:hypothetical protein
MQEPLENRIEEYVLGRMNPAEKADFERAIAADPELAWEVNIQRKLLLTVRHARRMELKRNLASAIIESKWEEKKKRAGFRMPGYSWVAIAAVFVLAIFAAVLIIQTGKKQNAGNPQHIVQKYKPVKMPVLPDSMPRETQQKKIAFKTKAVKTKADSHLKYIPAPPPLQTAIVLAAKNETDTIVNIPSYFLINGELIDRNSGNTALNANSKIILPEIKIHFINSAQDDSLCYTFRKNILTIIGAHPKQFREVFNVYEKAARTTYYLTTNTLYAIHPTDDNCTKFEQVNDLVLLHAAGLK